MRVHKCRWRATPTGASKPNAALEGCNGARVVFRHNTLIDARVASHGTESGGRNRSIRSYEIYANRWHLGNEKERWTAIFLRGETGVIFDNQVTGRYGSFALATNYRSSAVTDLAAEALGAFLSELGSRRDWGPRSSFRAVSNPSCGTPLWRLFFDA